MAHSTAAAFWRTTAENILYDTGRRLRKISSVIAHPIAVVSYFPKSVLAFTVAATSTFDPSNATMVDDDVQWLIQPFNFPNYKGEVDWIRSATTLDQCLTRLSEVLTSEGPLRAGSTGGTAGALSLLPTAGALIGAPARELWVVYKLVPIAGFLSMLLSLGGNIVPTNSNDYNLTQKAFNYGGFIGTAQMKDAETYTEEVQDKVGSSAAIQFARKVHRRADDQRGSKKRGMILIGVASQLFWIGILIFACWFLEAGTVIVWWCQAWGWCLFWYFMVAFTSVLENIASVPFSRQWTIRVSKAPEVTISRHTPAIAISNDPERKRKTESLAMESVQEFSLASPGSSASISPGVEMVRIAPSKYDRPILESRPTDTDQDTESHPLRKTTTRMSILADLERGMNSTSTIYIDPTTPQVRTLVPFYVIVSLEGVSTSHATLRVISKALSIGSFAAGTAIFASSTLTSISVGLMVLCLVLGAGVFGRVASMWMASELMKENPILHTVVQKEADAADHLNEILALPDLTFDVMGHIIVNGRCIHRTNRLFRWSTLFGILAEPFDITKLAIAKHKRRSMD